MPCRGNKEAETDFVNVADETREIIVKYKQSSDVILLGDMNASLFRDPPMARDKYLKGILSEMNLSLPDNYPEVHTYKHGSGKSIIDYIIHSKKGLVTSVTVFDGHCNTSPHMAVAADIPYVQSVALETENNQLVINKLKWDKVDKIKYKELVEDRLNSGDVLDVENESIDLIVEDLTDILVTSAKQCAPKQKRKHSKKKCKGWNIDISLACRDSKIMFHKWKVAGRPVVPNN